MNMFAKQLPMKAVSAQIKTLEVELEKLRTLQSAMAQWSTTGVTKAATKSNHGAKSNHPKTGIVTLSSRSSKILSVLQRPMMPADVAVAAKLSPKHVHALLSQLKTRGFVKRTELGWEQTAACQRAKDGWKLQTS